MGRQLSAEFMREAQGFKEAVHTAMAIRGAVESGFPPSKVVSSKSG